MEMKDRGRAQLEISGVETPKYKGNPTVRQFQFVALLPKNCS